MPLCAEHGQVYGEGNQCIVCAGGEPHHEAENIPMVVSQHDRNVYEQALQDLSDKFDALVKRVAKIEKDLK